jgi:threonine dehydrogenase-like Zn-dependent dehydrogenase
MKAVVYNGPRDVNVKKVADPKIEHPTDVLVKITTTNICGSTYTCTKVAPTWKKVKYLGMRTSQLSNPRRLEMAL